MTDPEMRTLVDEFATYVVRQTEAIDRVDPQEGNRFARRYDRAFEELRTRYGDAGRDALASLLTHERPDVRVKAAAYLLRHCTRRALAVLRAEATQPGLVGFAAGQAIERWEAGEWGLDF